MAEPGRVGGWRKPDKTLRIGAHVIAAGAGIGDVTEIKPPHYEGDQRGRQVKVKFEHGEHRWVSEMHVTVTR